MVFMNLNYTWYIIMLKEFRFVKDSPQISLIFFSQNFHWILGGNFFIMVLRFCVSTYESLSSLPALNLSKLSPGNSWLGSLKK